MAFQELIKNLPQGLASNDNGELTIRAEEAFKNLKKIFGGSGIQNMDEASVIELLNSYLPLVSAGALNLSRPITSSMSSMLHTASWFRRCTVVRWLLQQGVDANIVTNKGNTPLHFVCENASQPGTYDTVLTLLVAGGDISRANTSDSKTPLDKAKEQNSINIIEEVQLYIQLHPNIKLEELPIFALPVNGAQASSSSKINPPTVNFGINIVPTSPNDTINSNYTTPNVSIPQRSPSILAPQRLQTMNLGANRNSTVPDKDPRMLMKAEQNFTKLKNLFEKMAASPISKTDDEVVYQFLIENVAFIEQGVLSVNRDFDLKTKASFMHVAVSRNMLQSVMAMLVCGYDVTKINVKKNSAMHLAVENMDQQYGSDIVCCLLAFSAVVETGANLDGKTPLEMTTSTATKNKLCSWLNLQSAAINVFSDLKTYLSDSSVSLMTKLLRCQSPINWSKFSSSSPYPQVKSSDFNVSDELNNKDDTQQKADKFKKKGKATSTVEITNNILKEIETETSTFAQLPVAAKEQISESLLRKIGSKKKSAALVYSNDLESDSGEFDELFSHLDLNGSGVVTFKDLINFHNGIHGCNITIDHMYALMPNQDLITKSNFRRVLMSLHLSCSKLEQLKWDFKLYDYESRGFVSSGNANSLWELHRTTQNTLTFAEYESFRSQNPYLQKNRILFEELEANLIWAQFCIT